MATPMNLDVYRNDLIDCDVELEALYDLLLDWCGSEQTLDQFYDACDFKPKYLMQAVEFMWPLVVAEVANYGV